MGENKDVIQAGTIADGAVFSLKEVRLADKTLKNIEVRVDQKLENPFVVGQTFIERFGSFEFDTKNLKLVITP